MNKDLLSRYNPLTAAVVIVAALFLVLFGVFGIMRWSSQGQVLGRVEVAGTPVGGLSRDHALAALNEIEERHLTRTNEFIISDHTVTLTGAETGLNPEVDRMLDQVMAIGREGNIPYQFLWWLGHLFKTEELGLVAAPDRAALYEIFDRWDEQTLARPVNHGGLLVEDGTLQPNYPNTGMGINRAEATTVVAQSLTAITPEVRVIPTEVIEPALTRGDIDTALEEARSLTGSPIKLVAGERSLQFSPAQLAWAYVATTVSEGEPGIEHHFDSEIIDEILDAVRGEYEAAPVNARFFIDGDHIGIRPSSVGTRIDPEETAANLLTAARTSGRTGELPIVVHAQPARSTTDLENMGIKHLVSSFTTYHQCCEARVKNIQLMADELNMAIIPPGAQFSVNAYVGERTEADGYLPAPTIVGGELVDTVGGGVSQLATTIYNAVFWGGYQDIEHRPHTVWFSRYPEGIEATISWRRPELVFRNNTDKHILINTRYTDTSITVRIFGDNDGRTVRGDQSDGRTRMTVVNEGGPNARHVVAQTSDRFATTTAPPPTYVADPTYSLNQQTTRQSEREGWTVVVNRKVLRGGEVLLENRDWTVVYRPQRAIYVVHPCRMPGANCPAPTTTTKPPPPPTTPTTPATPPPTTTVPVPDP